MTTGGRNDRRIRVVHLVESLGRGGLERVVETLATGMDRERYDVRVLTLASEGAAAERLRGAGIPVERPQGRPVLRPRFVGSLARRLAAMDAYVVHGHGYFPGVLARAAGRWAGVPCRVAHRHTTDEGERMRHRVVERIAGRLGRTVCCSEAVRERMVNCVGTDPVRSEVVYNGVPVERFDRRRDPAAIPTLICVASMRPLKGHRVLLEAVYRLARRRVPLRLLLVGDGPERGALEWRVQQCGLSDYVDFLGERDDVPELLARSDLFVLPTTGREGLGIAALEAMAARLPVVASSLGGLTEVVRHGRTGLLVLPGDPEPLAGAIYELLHDPRRAEAMGRAGRERVERFFTARAMVERIESIYRQDLEPETETRTVLFLSSRGTSFGGGQEGLRMLATSLDPTRYRPRVVVPETGGLAADLTASGVPTTFLPLPRIRSPRILGTAHAAMRLRRLARETRPAVVHVDGTRTALYALALPRSIRRVWHLRDVRPDPLDRWLGPRFDRLLAVCRAVIEIRFPEAPEARVRVIPNAVPSVPPLSSREAIRRRLGVDPDELLLLTAGRVEPQKGVRELIRALERLVERGLQTKVVVAGESIEDEQEILADLARELDVSRRFELLGRRDDLPELMEAADLLIHPSWHEAAPRVVLEAMASGLPVVATSVGGVPEIMNGSGLLVPPRDPEGLAEAVEQLARQPALRREIGLAARRRYERLFTPDRHLEAVQGLYDDLLGGGHDRVEAT